MKYPQEVPLEKLTAKKLNLQILPSIQGADFLYLAIKTAFRVKGAFESSFGV